MDKIVPAARESLVFMCVNIREIFYYFSLLQKLRKTKKIYIVRKKIRFMSHELKEKKKTI